MNKTWITALTVAGVAGSAGAAYAGVAITNAHDGQVEAQGITAVASVPSLPSPASAPGAQTATYQVGSAGTVTISNTAGVISVQSALPAAGWTVMGYTNPAGHVEVQFTNSLQTVTFNADVVSGVTVASLAMAPNPGAVDTTIAAPMELEPITSPVLVPEPLPATPAPTLPSIAPAPPVTSAKQPTATAPTTPKQTPAPVTTTSTSKAVSSNSGGEHEDDEDDSGYENEEEDDD